MHAILWATRQTQAGIAAELGITATTLSKKLRGTVPLTVDELVTIAELLEVDVAQLIGGAEPLDPAAYAPRARDARTG